MCLVRFPLYLFSLLFCFLGLQRLAALKKAYADIILNTAKEAAARIMVSERKALRFQHELQVAKEEALRMLLRLKQMMDSKISEAESTCLSQQRKIEELEAQLHEAEDIVSDLRGELREVNTELERVKSNKENGFLVGRHNSATHTEVSEENRFCTSPPVLHPAEYQDKRVAVSDMKDVNLSQRNEGYKTCSRIVHMGNSFLSHTDLPSIILRSKEPELYRNGCTQRIRACEGNPLGKELSLSGKVGKRKTETDGRNDGNTEVSAMPVHKVDGMDDTEKKVVEADSLVFFKSSHRKRRRANRSWKNRVSLDGNLPHLSPKMDGQPNNFCLRPHSGPVNDHETTPISSSDGVEPVILPGSAEICGNKPELVESCGVENSVFECEGLTEKMEPPGQETGSTGSSGITVLKSDIEEVDVQLLQSGSKISDAKNETYSLPSDRSFKYTFQRKRKRGASREFEDASIQNCGVETNEEEKQNVLVEPQRPKLSAESSRDSRRMAQVARQLISLSEKKWWQ
nr:Golgin subfamily A member 6-like protein [Ipomoea batatas]